MTEFKGSAWADRSFSDHYLERADLYVMERRRLLALMLEISDALLGGRRGIRVADLGCGDGILAETLLGHDPTVTANLIDASDAMLERARQRLSDYSGCGYIQSGFEDIISGRSPLPVSDLVVSSMAIHHNDLREKALLFQRIQECLAPGGVFINIDTVRPRTAELEKVYFSIWREWMGGMMQRAGVADETPDDVIRRYKDPASTNKPDTVEDQLDAMSRAGFVNTDCYYKNGIFAIFGGQKV